MENTKIPYKIYLDESEIPTQWYNVRADMKNKPAPLLNPATLKPMTAEELYPVFCKELVAQELKDTDAYKFMISIKCTVRPRLSEHISLKKLSELLLRFTISLRVTIQAAVIN